MTATTDDNIHYTACRAHSFCVDFGVYRGEAIGHIDDLNLGDMYQLKSDADWMDVSRVDASASVFERRIAANMPVETLTTLAHLIFMTTTGRRADVFVTMSNGHLYLTCAQELSVGLEYVLIHIEKRDVTFEPVVVPTPIYPAMTAAEVGSNVIPMRLMG